MKRVLVPIGTDNDGPNIGAGLIHFARENYLKKLFKYGLLPVLISPLTPHEEAIQLLFECSGMVLLGGDDVNAQLYGQVNHPSNKPVIQERDQLERALVQAALKNKIPTLGLCRGCQILAIASGGTLIQHLPDYIEDERHGPSEYINYDSFVHSTEHSISIKNRTRTQEILGSTNLVINSAHHQAIDKLSDQWIIAATSPGNIIEIIEHIDSDYFCFGIQSHPEVIENGPLEPFFMEFSNCVHG